MYKGLLTLVCGLLLSLTGISQGYVWSYHPDAGNPGGVNTETDAPGQTTWTDILDGPTSANTWSSTVAIPFTFQFFGEDVTHLKASANGLITFDTLSNVLTDTNFALPSDSIPDKTIACFWDEFTASAPTGSGDDIRYNVFGTAPNRQVWIKWYSFELGNPVMSFVYMAAVLEEGTNNIYIVDQYSTSTNITSMAATVGLQNNATEAIQAGGGPVNIQGNGSGNSDNDYYQFTYLDSLDAAITQITNPSGALCPGTYNVELEVQNLGTTTIDSITLEVIVNGGTPTSFGFGGLNLDTLETQSLSLGSQTFSSGTVYDFEFYLTSVNETTDDDTDNDTLIFEDIQTGLLGSYTIDASTATGGSNFNSFADAASALNNFGVCGAVVFDVDSGTYTDSVYLGEILGASATNTITFDGGNAMDAVLAYDGAGVEAAWQLDGTDHLIVKNMTIQNTKTTSDAWCVHLSNEADSNTFDSCRFILPIGTTSDVQAIVASSSLTFETGTGNNANYLTVSNSYFEGGETGIHIEGNNDGSPVIGFTLTNNTFREHDDEAIEMDDVQLVTITGNDVDDITNSSADGFYLFDVWDFDISSNRIHVSDYAIYMFDANDGFTPTANSLIVNNMVISDADYGLYMNDFESTNIYHNSVIGSPAIRINDQSDADIRNNIFIGVGDFAFESDDTLASTDIVDYNIYDSDATNMFDIQFNTYTDLAAWQAASSGFNANSLEGTPVFAGLDDLHVLDTLANNVGDNSVGVTVDIDGESRPMSTTVDIGADEYTPVVNDIALIEILSPTGSVCEDSLQFIELVIQNAGLNEQDTIPFTIQLLASGTVTYLDTLYSVINGYSTDTITLGPISTFNLSNFYLQIYSMLANDEDVSNDTVGDSIFVVALPDPVSIVHDTICATTETGTLSASGTLSTIRWFETSTSDSVLFAGDTFTAIAPGPGSYWVAQVAEQNDLVGAPDPSIGSALNFSSVTAQHMLFDVYDHITLDSLSVYPNDTGNVEILLQDAGGSTLQTATVAVSPSSSGAEVRVAVGFSIAPGSYRLAAGSNTTTGGLIRNSTGASYPYEIPGIVSITGNSFSPSYYYYYYNWRVSYAGCEGERTEAFITWDSTTVELPADETICPGEEEFIEPVDLGFVYASYLWHDGSTDTAYTATGAGTVAVTVTSPNGCVSSDVMQIDTFPQPHVDLGSDTAFCEGDTFEVTIDAGPGFVQYLWSNAGQTQAIIVDYAGTFTVSVTDNNGCEATDEFMIGTNPLPVAMAGEDTTICEDSAYVLPAAGGGLTTEWTDENGTVVTEAAAAGTYYMHVTDLNGCSGVDTLIVETEDCSVGLPSISNTLYSVYPNPSRGVFFLEFERSAPSLHLEVYDGLGNLVYTDKVNETQRVELDLSDLAKGYYLLKLRSKNDQSLTRIILQ